MSDANARDAGSPPLIDIRALLRVLWQRRGLIVATTAVLILVAVVYLAITRPVYTATAVVLVDPRDAHTTDSNDVLSGIGSDSAAIASQVAVISSREMLSAVFESEHIARDPEFSDSGLLSGVLLFGGSSRRPTEQMIFDRFISNVAVEREGLTYVLNISFKSQNPEKAARIVNAIVERYVGSQVTEKSDANAEVTDLLHGRIGSLQQAVTEAEHAVEAFKVANNIFDSGAGGTVVQSQIDQLNVQLLAAQDVARQAASKYEQAVAAGKTPKGLIDLAGVVSSTAADRLRDEYNQRSTEYASAQAVFGAKHPTLIKLAAEVARIEALMVREVERITLELETGRDLADRNVEKIESDIAKLRTESNLTSQKAVELRQLERNAEATRQVLEQFLKRSEETSQLQDLQLSDARVISSATPPLQATWPKPGLLLTVCALLGVVLGSATALFLGPLPNEVDETRRSGLLRFFAARDRAEPATNAPNAMPPADARAAPDAPVQAEPIAAPAVQSASAPEASKESVLPTFGTLRTRFRAPVSSLAPTRAEIDAARLEVTTYPQSPFALQVATLISRLLGTLDATKTPYVLLMSSASARFEKSRLGHSIAAGLQRVGASVVVVDLDPFPTARTAADQGGSSLLQQAMSGHLPIRSAVSIDPHSGLATIVDDSRVVWDGERVNRLLTGLAPAFKFIVMIGKPISDRNYSQTLSAVADQEIFALAPEEQSSNGGEEIARAIPAEARAWKSLLVIDYGTEEPRSRTVARSPEVQAAISEIRRSSRYAALT